MSEGMIIRRGGGASLKATDALLRVQAPAGSVVTITKGGTTKTDQGHENADDNSVYDYYFIIHQSQFDSVNPWTVTATLNGDTASDTIIIDAADEYDVELTYRVPSQYQEVEFLQGTGTQYLRLPIYSDEVKSGQVHYSIVASVGYAALFGSSPSASAGKTPGAFGLFVSTSGDGQGFQYNGTRTGISVSSVNVDYVVDYTVISGSQSYTVNGSTTTAAVSGTPSHVQTFLFALSYNGSVKSAEITKTKVYSFTCQDANGDNIIELVPCYRKADSVAGMWDRVSKTFLTNAGSGTFTVGADV